MRAARCRQRSAKATRRKIYRQHGVVGAGDAKALANNLGVEISCTAGEMTKARAA